MNIEFYQLYPWNCFYLSVFFFYIVQIDVFDNSNQQNEDIRIFYYTLSNY